MLLGWTVDLGKRPETMSTISRSPSLARTGSWRAISRNRLEILDARVFFDEYFEANFLGKAWSSEFKKIFAETSRLVVCLLDKHHSEKIWPTFERECFQPRVADADVIPVFLEQHSVFRNTKRHRRTQVCLGFQRCELARQSDRRDRVQTNEASRVTLRSDGRPGLQHYRANIACRRLLPAAPDAQRWGSSRQGCESRRVQVPLPSVARNGRLAYPRFGEVTNRKRREHKSHGCLVSQGTAVGATWVASKSAGLNIRE